MQIFVVNSKGGSGKTTIATQLAGYYAQQRQVLLIDRDIQKSASDWFQNRPVSLPNIQLIKDVNLIPIGSHEDGVVIHDLPAGFIPTLDCPLFAAHEVNKMLIPIMASPTDIKAGLRFIMAIYKSGLLESKIKAGFIANRTRSNIRYHQTLMEFLHRVDIPLIGTLRDSQNYIRTMERSISIFDLPAHSMKQDLEQWQPIIEWLEN
jgi:chromosome partitioning protein